MAFADDMELTGSSPGRIGARGWRAPSARAAQALVEACWLVALAVIPLVVNPYSRQIFEPDKTAVLILIVTVMTLAALGAALLARAAGAPAAGALGRHAAGWAGLVAASVVVSTLLSLAPRLSWAGSYVRRQGALTELLLLLFFLIVARHLVSREQWFRAATVMVVASVPICVYTLFQRLGFDPVPWSYALRVGATAGNPVFLAAYLALLPPVTLVLAVEQFRRGEGEYRSSVRLGLLIYALVLQVAALLQTESRGPFLALAAGLAFMAQTATHIAAARQPSRRVLMRRVRWTVAILGVAAVATLAALGRGAGPAVGAPILGRLATALDPAAKTAQVRLMTWQGAAERFSDGSAPRSALRPLIGHGPETFSLAFLGVAPAAWTRLEGQNRVPDRAHNEIWELLITRGALGVAAWLALLGWLVVVGLRDLGLLPDRARAVALGGWMLAALVVAVTSSLAFGRVELLGPAVGCGLAAGLIGFSTFTPQPPGCESKLPLWRQLAALALLSSCLIHWVEIQVGFGLTLTRVVFFACAGALVGLGRSHGAAADGDSPGSQRRGAIALGLILAATLSCLAFALSISSTGRNPPAELLLGGLIAEPPAPLVTPLLAAILGALAVGWALLPRSSRGFLSTSAGWPFAGAVGIPVFATMAFIYRAVGDTGIASDATAAAESGVLGFRLLALTLLVLLAAAAFLLVKPPTPGEPRHRFWITLSAIALLVAGGAGLSRRIALDRVEADTFAKHGLAWLEIGAADVGHQLLDRASRLAPGEAAHWLERGRTDLERATVASSAGHLLGDALASLEQATRLAPLEADGWANLGMTRLLLATGSERDAEQLAAADRAYGRALELRPAWPQVLAQRAGVAALSGDEAAAAALLNEARRLANDLPPEPDPETHTP